MVLKDFKPAAGGDRHLYISVILASLIEIAAKVESVIISTIHKKVQSCFPSPQSFQSETSLCVVKSTRSRLPRGFSLVEVVLAIGVTSFALLGMVALVPVGLKTSRQAADASTQSQIVQYARNQLEMTSFANLSVWNNATPLYFDNQGLITTSTDPQQIYSVTFSVGNLGLSTNNSTTNSYLGTSAQLVQMYIVNKTMPGSSATNLYPIVVPNAGF
jgi:uncharacterized protein (TIGR02598 family)